jgi:uncharacterized protein
MGITHVLWAAWEGPGLEHLRLTVDASGVRADSLIIAVDDNGRPFRGGFTIECEPGWMLKRVRIELLEDPARRLALRTDGRGRWVDAGTGAALPLDGCLDVDIYPSPFTNSLPIQRLTGAAIGEPVALDVAWVGLPDLTIRRNRQEYTLLERRADGSRWRFRSPDGDFTAELPVDGGGLVLDYPGIARRLR